MSLSIMNGDRDRCRQRMSFNMRTTTTGTAMPEDDDDDDEEREGRASIQQMNRDGGIARSSADVPLQNDDAASAPFLIETAGGGEPLTRTTAFWWTPFAQGFPPENVILLNLVAVIWGTQHPVIKMVVDDCDASTFSLVRFGLGAVIATPVWLASKEETTPQTLRWGLEMGMWMFLGYAFQAVGLATTTAQRSGFFLYLNVKLVPFFAFVLLGRQISIPTWISALVAFTGTALLAYDGSGIYLNTGDLWSIAAAAASAMFILRLEPASKAVPNAAALNASCLWVVAAASGVWSVEASTGTSSIADNAWIILTTHPWEIMYLSGVTTALANYIQTKAQRNVTPERASVIYAMDPVYGAVASNMLLGETLSGLGMVGAACITLAAATNVFLDLGPSKDVEEEVRTESEWIELNRTDVNATLPFLDA
jgi:drug/metabolite transporter (DMT)-like permease